jgi:lipoprotein-anchoring transpeptidase ErfK/SrfK
VIDTDTLAARIATALTDLGQNDIILAIPMVTAQYETQKNQVIVADWDKYIDVNISTQKMTAYLKGGIKVGEWSITSGRKGLDTPIGTFLIRSKTVGPVCMPNPPSSVPLCGIHYVSNFTAQGHAIHEAWWRSSFGGQDYIWNGSHGCINAPIDVAKFIYDWAPVGTPITTHF